MKQFLLSVILIFFTCQAFPQKDPVAENAVSSGYRQAKEEPPSLKIFPVPFRDGRFTISGNKEISALRITNVIGQEIFRATYGIPVNEINVTLSNSGSGIYIIVITFSDKTKTVRRITSEGSSS